MRAGVRAMWWQVRGSGGGGFGIRWLAGLVSMVLVWGAPPSYAEDWTYYTNKRHGYMIGWPTAAFAEEPSSENEDGRLMVSRDGQAQLLMGAFPNEENYTLEQYRTYLLEGNYRDARIDYAPVRQRWFVLSGTRGDTVFYERVTFTCGGRLINSWALLYPQAEQKRFDRLVERIARTYSAGAGANAECR